MKALPVWFLSIALLVPVRTATAEILDAHPLTGTGEYEFFFFTPERRTEIDMHSARFTELESELSNFKTQLKKVEIDLIDLEKKTGQKKSVKLEWSPLENVTGYSLKIFNKEKELIDTHRVEENTITLELAVGDYYFQVAAVTKFKTGTYSRMSALKVTKGKPSLEQLKIEEEIALLQERIRTTEKLRSDHFAQIRLKAVSSQITQSAKAEVKVPNEAVFFIAVDKKSETPQFSEVLMIPGKDAKISATATLAQTSPAVFLWGIGGLAAVQDTRLDFFRTSFGIEAFVRYDKAYLKFFHPQLKFLTTYSSAKTLVYDAMFYANIYPGVYYPILISKGFSFVMSLSMGPNLFFILSSVASASVLQWGVMPAIEMQYAVGEKTSLYAGGAINFTFDPSGEILKFIPFNLGIIRRF